MKRDLKEFSLRDDEKGSIRETRLRYGRYGLNHPAVLWMLKSSYGEQKHTLRNMRTNCVLMMELATAVKR